MKEWLLKTEDGKYYYHRDDMDCCPKYVEKIEIPEGAKLLTSDNCGALTFWSGDESYNIDFDIDWGFPCDSRMNFKEYCDHSYEVIWKRKVHQIENYSIFIDESEIVNEEMESLDDKVNQPNHYANFSIECIDAMQAMLSREEFIGYLRGNIFKYLWRYKLKNGVEDLKKAQWYQNKLIEVEENE